MAQSLASEWQAFVVGPRNQAGAWRNPSAMNENPSLINVITNMPFVRMVTNSFIVIEKTNVSVTISQGMSEKELLDLLGQPSHRFPEARTGSGMMKVNIWYYLQSLEFNYDGMHHNYYFNFRKGRIFQIGHYPQPPVGRD